jgi:4-hydroxy-tetrahydrodipicolinate synthase
MKKAVIETTVDEVNGRVPVYVGVSDPSYLQVMNNIALVEKIGGDAVVVLPPFYYPLGNDELVDFYGKVADHSPLPILLYNIPSLTKTHLDHDLVVRISGHERIIGLKDSQGDMTYMQGLLQHFKDRKDFHVFIGVETLLAEGVLFHGAGGIPGGANVAPNLFVKLYNAAKKRDFKNVDRLQAQVVHLNGLYRHGRFWSSYLKGVKTALSLMGICSDVLTDTFDPFHAPEREAIRKEMKQMGLL